MEIRPVSGNLPAPAQVSPPAAAQVRQAAAQAVATTTSQAVEATGKVQDSAAAAKADPSREEVQQALEQVQQVVRPLAQSLRFSIDEDTQSTIVKIIDTDTDKVIRQIPSEEMLQIAKALDKFTGLLMKDQA